MCLVLQRRKSGTFLEHMVVMSGGLSGSDLQKRNVRSERGNHSSSPELRNLQ